MEELVFASNKSYVLTQEIKKISKYYIKEKVEHVFITPHSGQKVTFITTEGRIYLSCVNYSEVFGYNIGNVKAKIDNLNYFNLRDRDVIFGLIELYDLLISKFKEKYNVKENVVTLNTEILQELVNDKNISKEKMEYLKKSRLLQDVEYSKIDYENVVETKTKENDFNNQNKLEENKETDKKKPKFYF